MAKGDAAYDKAKRMRERTKREKEARESKERKESKKARKGQEEGEEISKEVGREGEKEEEPKRSREEAREKKMMGSSVKYLPPVLCLRFCYDCPVMPRMNLLPGTEGCSTQLYWYRIW